LIYNQNMKEVFGILAISLGIGAGIPYIHSILRKNAKPHRVSWAIWASLGLITLTSYLAKGAHWSALLAAAAAFNGIVIFMLSFKYGTGGTSLLDKIALLIGLSGIVLWALTDQASYALMFSISADAIGTILTALKAYKNPGSESGLAWCIAATASLCGLLAVHSYTLVQTIYPSYALVGGISLASITIISGRRKAGINKARLKI
jgi:hypothetical protein